MALDDFEDDYRKQVTGQLDPNSGIAGPALPDPLAQQKPQGAYDLEAFRKAWTSTGDVNNAQSWLDQNRNITQGVTLKNEKAYDPSGKFIADLVGNYSGGDPSQRSRIFLDGIGSNGQPRVASASGGVKTAAAGARGGAAPAPAPASNNFLTQIRQMIMGRLGEMQKPASMDDPAMAAQQAAYSRQVDRGAADSRAAMAERAAGNGLLMGGQSSGGFDSALQGIYENAGESKAANAANLMGEDTQRRYSQIQALMNMALQSGDAESARAMQMELEKMELQFRREGLSQQGQQFNASLGLQRDQMGQQGQQWNDSFGRQLGRDYESDYMNRVLLGLGS